MELPEVEGCDYLVRAFILSGMTLSNGMGSTPLTWQELSAFREVVELDAWESKQIMQMSKAYCSMMYKAEERIPAPYSRELTDEDREWTAKQQLAAFDRIESQASSIKIKAPK